jgi:tRNA (guanine-N7-)-methyltransferase
MAVSRGKRLTSSPRCIKKLANSSPPSRVYGRKQTRPPKGERKEAFDTLLPALQISSPPSFTSPFFKSEEAKIWLEIGFGNGEHLKGLMERHPDRHYIGAEPFINGMAAFLNMIRDMPQDNIRVWMDDAILLVDAMPDGYLEGIYVLNPDPWPKRRHHKRRMITQANLSKFARVLKPGGTLVMASDVDDLSEWMVTQASNHPAFEWTAERADDWRVPPPDWIRTRYQDRGEKAGRKQSYLLFVRR